MPPASLASLASLANLRLSEPNLASQIEAAIADMPRPSIRNHSAPQALVKLKALVDRLKGTLEPAPLGQRMASYRLAAVLSERDRSLALRTLGHQLTEALNHADDRHLDTLILRRKYTNFYTQEQHDSDKMNLVAMSKQARCDSIQADASTVLEIPHKRAAPRLRDLRSEASTRQPMNHQ